MGRLGPAFDLDGTLVNSIDLILSGLASNGFVVLPERDGFFFKFERGYAPPPDFQWDLFFYRLFTEKYTQIDPIDPDAHSFLEEIVSYTRRPIRIITARPYGAVMHYCTMKLLDKCFPGIDFSVEIVGSGSEKYRYLMGHCVYFEDRRKTALDLASRGIITFMRSDVYNRIKDKALVNDLTIKSVCEPRPKLKQVNVYDSFARIMHNSFIMDLLLNYY